MRCGSGHMRHWFTRRGSTGGYLPYCWRCGANNPRCPVVVSDRRRRGMCGRKTVVLGFCPRHSSRDLAAE